MTIKQLADLCGTHKTGIRRTIDRLGLSDQLLKDENGVVQIPEHIAEKVAAQYQNEPETPQDTQEQKPEPYQNPSVQALLTALDALKEQLAVKDRQLETQAQQIAAQQQTIDTLTTALSTAQALTAGSLQALHHLTAPTTVAADQEQEQPESAPVEQEATQTEPDRPEQTETSGAGKDIEAETRQQEATERPAAAPQMEPEPDTAPKAPRKGLFGLFRRNNRK